MKGFSIIVATDLAGGIGKGNQLPWHFSEDMRHFKTITMAPDQKGRPNVVIMGRKTWESLPSQFRPLPGRQNVVLSTDRLYPVPPGVLLFSSFDQAAEFFCAQKADDFGAVFVIGGAQVYAEAVQHKRCDTIYQTIIHQYFECDAFFPESERFRKELDRKEIATDKGIKLVFLTLGKQPSA